MKLFRRVLFWCHLTVGVIAGLVILIMSATGVLLTYERQITYWADTRDNRVASPSPNASRLSVETLLAKAREAQPDTSITTVTLRDATPPWTSISTCDQSPTTGLRLSCTTCSCPLSGWIFNAALVDETESDKRHASTVCL